MSQAKIFISANVFWDHLNYALKHFTVFETTAIDQKNYEQQRKLFEDILRLGQDFNHAGIFNKTKPQLLLDTFKKLNDFEMAGPLSLSFAEYIFYPFLKRLEHLDPDSSLAKLPFIKTALPESNLLSKIEDFKKQYKKPVVFVLGTKEELVAKEKLLNEMIGDLRRKIQRLEKFYSLVDKKIQKPTVRELLDLLDINEKYKTLNLDEYLDKLGLTVIKNRLLKYEKHHHVPLALHYHPDQALMSCREEVDMELDYLASETERLYNEAEGIRNIFMAGARREEQKREDVNSKITPYKKALTRCLEALLTEHQRVDGSKETFEQSEKCKELRALQQDGVFNDDMESIQIKIESLREIVSRHRDSEKGFHGYWTLWGYRKPESLSIFEQFFDKDNAPVVAENRKSLRKIG